MDEDFEGVILDCGYQIEANTASKSSNRTLPLHNDSWIQISYPRYESLDISTKRVQLDSVQTSNLQPEAQKMLEDILASYCCSQLLDVFGKRIYESTDTTTSSLREEGTDDDPDEDSTLMKVIDHKVLIYVHDCPGATNARDIHILFLYPEDYEIEHDKLRNLQQWFVDACHTQQLFSSRNRT